MTEGRGFPVRIGGSRTMDEIVRAGRYDGVHSFINQENFPLAPRPQGEVAVELVALGRIATSDEAVAELGLQGLRRPDAGGGGLLRRAAPGRATAPPYRLAARALRA